MIRSVSGNTTGLKPSQQKILERTYLKRTPVNLLVSPEMVRHLVAISSELGRQVGVLVSRSGHVEATFVGDAHRIYLPDVGRQRGGMSLLRGVRHIHTVFRGQGLHQDDIADLTKLKLDAVCTIDVDTGHLDYAFLQPGSSAKHEEGSARSVFDLHLDFSTKVTEIEDELRKLVPARKAGTSGDRAVVLGIYADRSTAEWRLAEICELAATAGVSVQDTMVQLRRDIDSHFVVGRGKLEEAVLRCLNEDANLIIIDHNLTPAQARAIASFSDLKVIDRTQLILDIFALHAQSRDGKLQVELAQLRYNLPRLTDLDAGLSRLTGGIGGRGPGETKLEINRRRARDRITRLEKEIAALSKQRSLRRSRRQNSACPIVSIVGYTNAGKSTLLNTLTQSKVLVANQLFATLDPTSRRLRFPKEREAIVTDTVGFIRDLPPDLIKAFRATLEELEGADLLLHVIDAADPVRHEKMVAVDDLLESLELGGLPRIIVYNKCDLVDATEMRMMVKQHDGVAVSAVSGLGLERLVQRIAHKLWQTDALPDEDAWAREARGERIHG